MTELDAIDSQARERALDVSHSFIVQAPAGSGKTTVLTQRYLKLLCTVEEPEQVLAITFTRKAAGEMRERVQNALAGEGVARTSAEALTMQLAAATRAHAEQRGWGLESTAARLRIQTIDAFNGYLAAALPITSGGGISRAISDDPADLYAIAARETLLHAEADPQLAPQLDLVLRRLDDEWSTLEKLIAEMLPRRSEWLVNLPQLSEQALAPRIERSLAIVVAEELAQASAVLPEKLLGVAMRFAPLVANNMRTADTQPLAAWLDRDAPLRAEIEDLPRWRALRWLALTSQGGARRRMTRAEGIPPDDENAKQLRDHFLEQLALLDESHIARLEMLGLLPDPVIAERDRAALDALSHLLLLAAMQLKRTFAEHGECDHPEIAAAARQALTRDSSPTPLAERLGTRLQHILIDEFQDTSREQYNLLLTLTDEWSEGDGRTLFLVGDPMQSVYGFRNAEVGRFASVRTHGLGSIRLTPLELRRNFRSSPDIVEWCNLVFAQVFPREDDARSSAVRHLASIGAREDLRGATSVYRVEGEASVHAEAERVADLIAQLVRNAPQQTIGVLASTRPHLRAVRAALAERGVRYVGVKLEPLANIPVVRDLAAVARALDSPLDRIAWAAVLRAPFVGLALPDLTAVVDAAGEAEIFSVLMGGRAAGISPAGMARVIRAKDILLRAWAERGRETRAHLVERVWLSLDGPSCCSELELNAARKFLAAMEEEDRRMGGRGSVDLEMLMDRLFADESAAAAAVSIMTIHGAKGLEFDHVFVVGVGRRGRPDESRLLNWLELPCADGLDHLLMAPIRSRAEDEETDTDRINSYLKALHRARARAERSRVAYVALTRARQSLHVFMHPSLKRKEQTVECGPHSNSLLENLWPAVAAAMSNYPAVGTFSDDARVLEGDPEQQRKRLPAHVGQTPVPAPVLAHGEISTGVLEEEIEFSWARQTARRVGTVVHEALERFGRDGLPASGDLRAHRPLLAARLASLGVTGPEAEAGATRALSALQAVLADERGRWLFDPHHRQAQSELAISGVRGGHIVNAVIDRTFIDGDGVRWIVDFKTSPHEGGDREGFLASEEERYRPQLMRYAELAGRLGPEPVRAGLYFPLLAAWREVLIS